MRVGQVSVQTILDWVKGKTLNPLLAKTFEDTLYEMCLSPLVNLWAWSPRKAFSTAVQAAERVYSRKRSAPR
jgi:hypothetical protein